MLPIIRSVASTPGAAGISASAAGNPASVTGHSATTATGVSPARPASQAPAPESPNPAFPNAAASAGITAPPTASATTNLSKSGSALRGSKASAPVANQRVAGGHRSIRSIQTASLHRKENEPSEDEQKTGREEVLFLNQPFTAEALMRSWNIFIETIQDDPHLANAMKACPPVLQGDYQIEVAVPNTPLLEKLRNLTREIENHLHHHLRNNRIQMHLRLTEDEENYRPFSSREKLECMVKKNPNLEYLYRSFGLDLD